MTLSTSPQHASYDAPDESDEEIMRAQRESEGRWCMPTSHAALKNDLPLYVGTVGLGDDERKWPECQTHFHCVRGCWHSLF